MTTFIGFNTQGQYKKFTLVDFELIKRDFLNALNIRQGELPGRPGYGTFIYDYVFENLDQVTEQAIVQEIQRVAGGDPRLYLNNVELFPQDNGILLNVEISVVPSETSQQLSIFFDQEQRNASYV
jgi:phage baseplate assembly protein W